MIKAKFTGSWSEASSILKHSDKLKRAINSAVLKEAHHARSEIIKGIRDQSPGGQAFSPLSALTLAIRRANGFRGKKIMMVTGGLRNSVVVKQTATGKVFVGVLRSARAKNGRPLYNIAHVQEHGATFTVRVTPKMRRFLMIQLRKSGIGTRVQTAGGRFKKTKFASVSGQMSSGVMVIRIPARPFMGPVFEKLASDKNGQRTRFTKSIARDMGAMLGR